MFHTGCRLHSNWCISWVVFLELQPAFLTGRLDLTSGVGVVGGGKGGGGVHRFFIYKQNINILDSNTPNNNNNT